MDEQIKLRNKIQEEINEEARMDKLIDKQVKRFLKQSKEFKIVNERKDCDAILYFYRKQPIKTSFAVDFKQKELPFNEKYTYFFIKNKNKHDGRQNTMSFKNNHIDAKHIFYQSNE